MSRDSIDQYPLPKETALQFATFIESDHLLTVPARDNVVLLQNSYSRQRLQMSAVIDDEGATTLQRTDGQLLQVRYDRSGHLPIFDEPVSHLRYRPRTVGTGPQDWLVEGPNLRINNWEDFLYMSDIIGGCIVKKLSISVGMSVRTVS